MLSVSKVKKRLTHCVIARNILTIIRQITALYCCMWVAITRYLNALIIISQFNPLPPNSSFFVDF